MFGQYISDPYAQEWQKQIQRGKEYLQRWFRLLDQANTTGTPLPTVSSMAVELKISEDEAEKLHHYAFEELVEDERDFLDTYRSDVLF
jgi:hypothetical protein